MRYYNITKNGKLMARVVPTVHTCFLNDDVIDTLMDGIDNVITEVGDIDTGGAPLVPVDLQLSGYGKPTIGLETLEYQMNLLEECREIGLNSGSDEEEIEVQDNLTRAYLTWDIDTINNICNDGLTNEGFVKLITRDATWREGLLDATSSTSVTLIGVGIFHVMRDPAFDGDKNILDVLSDEGYSIEEVSPI